MRTLSRRVRTLRVEKGLTKAALARRSGIATSTVRNIESAGETLYNPHLSTLHNIAEGLGVKVGELTNLPPTVNTALQILTREGLI